MKSLALSLLVAASLSLGSASAFAEVQGSTAPATMTSNPRDANLQAELHARRAQAYRDAARIASEKARFAFKVAENDMKQGFTYEAGVQRAKAEKYQLEAQNHLANAQREENLAAQYRLLAKQQAAQGQIKVGGAAKR